MRKQEFYKGMCIQLALIYFWCTALTGTDSFYSLYLLWAVGAGACVVDNDRRRDPVTRGTGIALTIVSVLFSVSVLLANYALFQPYTVLMNLMNLVLGFFGGIVVARNVLLWALMHFPVVTRRNEAKHPVLFFAAAAAVMAAINLAYLFFCKYPGVAPYDTVSQVKQAMGLSALSNWTPYWHTITIRFFYNIGFSLFGNVNDALGFYTACQAVFASVCCAYALVTLYQLGLPRWILGCAFFLYALLPYNIAFSVTIGKDVLFGLGLLLMLTAFCRILLNVGKSKILNVVFFVVGGLGFSLWRTNGWPVYLIFVLILAIALRMTHRKYLGVMAVVALAGWYFLNPYLQARDVPNGYMTETMAVPFQQIARVIVNERDLTEEENTLLSEIFDLDAVKRLYEPIRVDPIKFEAFKKSQREYFEENLLSYAGLWIRLGMKYPQDYLEAWVDQTKGFWHGGYDMGVYDKQFPGNSLGIVNRPEEGPAAKVFNQYFRLFERPDGLQFLKSIGFVVWITLICLFINIVKDRRQALLAVPCLILLISFWAGVPVYAEFRYAYPMFVTSPLVLFTTLAEPRK